MVIGYEFHLVGSAFGLVKYWLAAYGSLYKKGLWLGWSVDFLFGNMQSTFVY